MAPQPRSPRGPIRVLFVCTGNICRSPTADAVMRKFVSEAGLEGVVEVDSAGTTGYHNGHPADARSAAAGRTRGFDLSSLRSRRIRLEDYTAFDYLVAMDEGHLAEMRGQCPAGARGQLVMFRDYCSKHSPGDVPDPYYGGDTGFEDVLDLVEDGCRGLLDVLRSEARP
ncbi:MAG: low molecular weight protein-tyrosine-phosphatase [Myxococcota bacterium]